MESLPALVARLVQRGQDPGRHVGQHFLVREQDLAFLVDDRHAHRQRLEHGRQHALRLAQRLVGLLAVGDVEDVADEAEEVPGRREPRAAGVDHPAVAAVDMPDAVFEAEFLLPRVGIEEGPARLFPVVRMDHAGPALAEAFFPALPGKFVPAARQERAAAIGFGHPQHRRRRVGEFEEARLAARECQLGQAALQHDGGLVGGHAQQQALVPGREPGRREAASSPPMSRPIPRRTVHTRSAGPPSGWAMVAGPDAAGVVGGLCSAARAAGNSCAAASCGLLRMASSGARSSPGQADIGQVEVERRQQHAGQAGDDVVRAEVAPDGRQGRDGDQVARGPAQVLQPGIRLS
jgi:hypothetical protein